MSINCSHSIWFRPGDSTVNQLLSITHQIYSAFQEFPSRETRAVLSDISKHLIKFGMVSFLNIKTMVFLPLDLQ